MNKKDSREKFVVFIDKNAKDSFEKLKQGKFEDKQLYGFINRAIDDLRKNPLAGVHMPNKQCPKEYSVKYGADNLWKYDLPNAWRLIYTVKGTQVKIVAAIIEWFCHKDYERKFGYRKK